LVPPFHVLCTAAASLNPWRLPALSPTNPYLATVVRFCFVFVPIELPLAQINPDFVPSPPKLHRAAFGFRFESPQVRVLAYCLKWYYNLLQRSYSFCKVTEERVVRRKERARTLPQTDPTLGRVLGPAWLIVVALLAAACRGSMPPTSPTATRSAPSVGQAPLALPAGQRLRFEHISVEHGLSQSTVTCALQDSRGFMWFGTRDGLSRYDGSGFKVYRHDPQDPHSLGYNQVTALAEDQGGMLWIGTDGGGLDRLDLETDTFVHYRHSPGNAASLADDLVLSLIADRDGVLWIGTRNGLDRFDRTTGQFIHHQNKPEDPHSLKGGTIESIYQDRESMLWVGTNGNGLNRFDPTTGRFTHFQHDPNDPHSLISNFLVSAICEDQSGDLWIGTFEGLDRLDRQTGRMAHYQHDPGDPHSLSNNSIASLHQDPSGLLWVGTLGGGLDILDPATGRFYHHRNIPHDLYSLSSNIVLSIYEGQMGVLWIGTAGGGVNRIDPLAERFALFRNDPDDPNSLSNNVVWSILQDQQQTLWIGTQGGGLNRFDRETGTWHHYRNDPADPYSLSNNNVSSVYEDRAGVLWVGTLGGGLGRLDRETERFEHFPPDLGDSHGLGNPFVYSILEDREGMLWIATDEGVHGGLHRFDRETGRFTHFEHDPNIPRSLSSNWIRALYEDRSGTLWISAVEAGLNRFDPITQRVDRYQHDPSDPNSLIHNSVTTIHEDHEGVLWLGTSGGGLNKYDPESETFVHYTVRDGLPSDVICGILAEDAAPGTGPDDGRGYLWISTSNGLSRFDPRTETFRNYDASDGLQSNEFLVRSSFRSSSGEIFFGGVNGFNAFYPDRIRDNSLVPPVVLTSLRQNGEDVQLRTAVEHAEAVRFHWPDNSFEFEFAALNYVQPEKNQYAYMLEGFDRSWNHAENRPYGKYTNLPGGTYTLRLKGSNNDGVWNEEGSFLAVTIVPPFWATWWFRGIVLLALVGIVVGGYRLRVRGIEARSRELERQVEQRTAELRHEIDQRIQVEEALRQSEREKAVVAERNRLARELHDSVAQSMYGVTLYAEVAAQLLSSGQVDEVTSYLAELKDTARESLAEMRLLIYELRPPVLEEEGLASALQARLEAVESRAGLEIAFNAEGENRLGSEIEGALYRIAQEALNNVLKHAQARRVVVSLVQDPRRVTLEIADDGLGFDPSEASRGGGMGLRGMRERAAEIGARLEVQSAVGSGTMVRVVWEAGEGSRATDE
jgi:signal transduction histidine kinase/ligand-binding sensor domain-containing protein